MSNTSVKLFFSTKASGGFACPRQILVGGEGLNTPAPCSAAYCAKDAYRQSRPVLAHMDISLRAFSLGAWTAISKNSSQRGRRRGRNNLRNGDFGRARKQAKVGEGSETARRLGRFSSVFVASIEQHQELNLTSRYWSQVGRNLYPFSHFGWF